jgi:hypothetical protein
VPCGPIASVLSGGSGSCRDHFSLYSRSHLLSVPRTSISISSLAANFLRFYSLDLCRFAGISFCCISARYPSSALSTATLTCIVTLLLYIIIHHTTAINLLFSFHVSRSQRAEHPLISVCFSDVSIIAVTVNLKMSHGRPARIVRLHHLLPVTPALLF